MIAALVRELLCKLAGHDLVPVIDNLHRCTHCHTFKDLSQP